MFGALGSTSGNNSHMGTQNGESVNSGMDYWTDLWPQIYTKCGQYYSVWEESEED